MESETESSGMTDAVHDAVAAVFIEAGWAPHFGLSGHVRSSGAGWLVGGAPDPECPLQTHLKITSKMPDGPDTPDDPVEAARVLVRLHSRSISVADTIEPEEKTCEEIDAQTSEMAEDQAPVDLQTETPCSADGDLGSDILDADYDEAALGLPAPEPEPEDFSPDEIEHSEPAAGAFIFGDSLDHDRLIRQGQIWNHADMLVDALKAQTSWNESEFQAVQSHVVTHLDKFTGVYTGGDDGLYKRFVELSETRARLSYIEAHRDAQISYIRHANHQQVSEFDPMDGWP